MAELRELEGQRSCVLQPEHLIGRGPQCALRLQMRYVSAQHAVIRWNGKSWEVLDRGSRNGTHLNGELIRSGSAYELSRGAVVAFGHPAERWTLHDDAGPQVMLTALDSGKSLLGTDGVIGVPSAENPECTIYRNVGGCWMLELPDRQAFPIQDGHTFEFASRIWRFCCPVSLESTAAAGYLDRRNFITVEFSVSMDEEFVELVLNYEHRVLNLGCRSHNYLLLILARARLTDHGAGLPETACGWMYKEELARDLRMTPQQVDGEVFRIRKHLGQYGIDEAATMIERRPRTKQLRIGMPRIRITRV